MNSAAEPPDEEVDSESETVLVPDWPERLDGAPLYRFPWAMPLERQYARTWAMLEVQPKECPHCHRSWVRAPLEKVRLVNGDVVSDPFIGFVRCNRAGCWGLAAVFDAGNSWVLWPIVETPHERERAGLPVSVAEVSTFEAVSRLELANAERETAGRVENAVEKILAIGAEFHDTDADNGQRSTVDTEGKVVRRVLSSSARRDLVRLRKKPDV